VRVAIENELRVGEKARQGGDNHTTEFDLQQALPIWTPACPTWREMTSRIVVEKEKRKNLKWDQGWRRALSELAHRELKDVDEKDNDRHEEVIPRCWLLCMIT
jgi:hypothetical protein